MNKAGLFPRKDDEVTVVIINIQKIQKNETINCMRNFCSGY